MKRETAYKVNIKTILLSPYVLREGWDPNYLEVGEKKVSRVNIIGVVCAKENDLFILEDNSGRIPLRFFDQPKELLIGEMYLIIGRPREYNDERYIVPEITRVITEKSWATLRQKELEKEHIIPAKEKEQPKEKETKEKKVEISMDAPPQAILDVVQELDKGEGVPLEEIRQRIGPKCEGMIRKLIEEGEIFEIKPGVIKAL